MASLPNNTIGQSSRGVGGPLNATQNSQHQSHHHHTHPNDSMMLVDNNVVILVNFNALPLLKSMSARAQQDWTILTELQAVAYTLLLGMRIEIKGLQAKPELKGPSAVACLFDDVGDRYDVALEDGSRSFKLKPDDLIEVQSVYSPSPHTAHQDYLDEK